MWLKSRALLRRCRPSTTGRRACFWTGDSGGRMLSRRGRPATLAFSGSSPNFKYLARLDVSPKLAELKVIGSHRAFARQPQLIVIVGRGRVHAHTRQ